MEATSMELGSTPSEAVIAAVARRVGVGPLELETPLYDAVDPDKLDDLVEAAQHSGRSTVEISFEYYDYTVTVTSGGTVTLTE